MATPPKHPREMARPRRKVGALLTKILSCPVCRGDVKPVRYGEPYSVKLRCARCGVRFTVDVREVIEGLKAVDIRSVPGALTLLASFRPPR